MRTSRAADRADAATTILGLGCGCILQIAWVAALAAGVVLAVRWALTTHAFGL